METEWLCVASKKVRGKNRSRHQNVSCLYKWLLNDTLSETQSGLQTQWGPYDVSQAHGRVSLTVLHAGRPQDTGQRAVTDHGASGRSEMTGWRRWSASGALGCVWRCKHRHTPKKHTNK